MSGPLQDLSFAGGGLEGSSELRQMEPEDVEVQSDDEEVGGCIPYSNKIYTLHEFPDDFLYVAVLQLPLWRTTVYERLYYIDECYSELSVWSNYYAGAILY